MNRKKGTQPTGCDDVLLGGELSHADWLALVTPEVERAMQNRQERSAPPAPADPSLPVESDRRPKRDRKRDRKRAPRRKAA